MSEVAAPVAKKPRKARSPNRTYTHYIVSVFDQDSAAFEKAAKKGHWKLKKCVSESDDSE